MFVRNRGRGAHGAVLAGFAASYGSRRRCVSGRRRFQCRHHRSDGRPGTRRLRHGLRQPFHARRHHGGLSLAEGLLVRTAAFTLHYSRPSDQRPHQRISDVFATGHRTDRYRVGSGLLLQHRIAGEGASAWLAVGEVPALWFERQHGASRFRVLKWLPAYLRWYFPMRSPRLSCGGRLGTVPLRTRFNASVSDG